MALVSTLVSDCPEALAAFVSCEGIFILLDLLDTGPSSLHNPLLALLVDLGSLVCLRTKKTEKP